MLLALFAISLVSLVACGRGSASDSSASTDLPASGALPASSVQTAADQHHALYVDDATKLPGCDTQSEGWLAYEASESKLVACVGGTWRDVALKGENGEKGDAGEQGTAGAQGAAGPAASASIVSILSCSFNRTIVASRDPTTGDPLITRHADETVAIWTYANDDLYVKLSGSWNYIGPGAAAEEHDRKWTFHGLQDATGLSFEFSVAAQTLRLYDVEGVDRTVVYDETFAEPDCKATRF